jgi:hypothetical protein
MSHIVEAKTSIKNPNMVLLRQALELVAQQHVGGYLKDHYLSYYDECQPLASKLAIFTDVVERGIGVVIKQKTGDLTFIGDPYCYENEAEALQRQIIQTYVSLATMQALQTMGYIASAEDGEEGEIVLTGVHHYA